uniref:Uncharacterized protein n=1 Tax=Thermofilum adornatum TaxID=1365176 RepID=A0A7C1CET6_9CREN
MPGCDVHQSITHLVFEKICNDPPFSKYGEELYKLINNEFLEILIESVCDPDHQPDRVSQLYEYCICDGKEVDADTCKEILTKKEELQKSLFEASPEEKKYIERKLKSIPSCTQKREQRTYPAKHHGGTNIKLWWYYVYSASKLCLRGTKESAREGMKKLARALHYAQDGPISRQLNINGVLGTYTASNDELHDIYEKKLSQIIEQELNNFDIETAIHEGVNLALNEKPFIYSKSLQHYEISMSEAMKSMFKFTAYTFIKFIQLIDYVQKEKENLLKQYKTYKMIETSGYAVVLIPLFLILVSPTITNLITWTTLSGSLMIFISQLLINRIKPAICILRDEVHCRNYVKNDILTDRIKKEVKTITIQYLPVL